ncbi:hypothetical protein SPRG_15247 [Saprolegnia parasitica CBS 223.65]|uniref:Transmembrane protein 242 n=1 Tax=Saprolegnia parasitica (strain CBS 223.65) TaxID=695850 RepID=A0A067BYE9_SAPPC|nr:hypothetical protein SPRG_15247 [Saprolegnia parasitica CBS 223.65]KDO19592.1 hypothetical protein SPRG_15247 [Saprolegnia parasitica CBS 223.65]|eukprot:XP_012209690.1 hypothetical protein SPRG_15247 [Saprolegnia parasitica CBS 223.65]
MTSNESSVEAPSDVDALKYVAGTVCAGVFGGGFYLGVRRQKIHAAELAVLESKEAAEKLALGEPASPKPKVFSWWERALGLNKPHTPGGAAVKALLGGTILAVVGSTVFFSVLVNVADEEALHKFSSKMTRVFPPLRHGIIRIFGITPQAGPTPEALAQEDREWAEMELEMEAIAAAPRIDPNATSE